MSSVVGSDAAARLHAAHDAIVKRVKVRAAQALWHLDAETWARKGRVRSCISATVEAVTRWLERLELPDPEAGTCPTELTAAAPSWADIGFSAPDACLLTEVVRDELREAVGETGDPVLVYAMLTSFNAFRAEVASAYIQAQGAEMERYRDESVTNQHLAGRFLANASHDLRTPLTAVLGFAELLLEETYGTLSEEQRVAIGHIQNSAENLLEIVNNLLDIMQIRAGKLDPRYRHFALEPMLRHIHSILQPLAGRRKVRFTAALPDSLGGIEADEGIVRHIVYHLLESALRATPPDGEVVLSAERSDGNITVVAYDTALHFPAAAIENMNDAYPILENSPARGYEGWEIGLPLVRRYVEVLGGTLAIESDSAHGTAIRVRIPDHAPSGSGQRGRLTSQ